MKRPSRPQTAASRGRHSAAIVALAATGLVMAAVARTGAPRPTAIPPLPVLGPIETTDAPDYGDPFVLPLAPFEAGNHGSASYVLFGTSDRPDHIPTATSDDLHHWQRGPDAVPVLPRWANPDRRASLTWAPTVRRARGADGRDRYQMYVTVPEARSGRQCIAVLEASAPLGPYTDAKGGPLVCQAELGGSIDPGLVTVPIGTEPIDTDPIDTEPGPTGPAAGAATTVAVAVGAGPATPAGNGNGNADLTAGQLGVAGSDASYLLWKNDGNCCGLATSLWSQRLNASGTATTGRAHRLLTAEQTWQAGIMENPAMVAARGGGFWLFYSGNRFNDAGYATGLAYCPRVTGPCQETAEGPFLAGTADRFSPGGLDVFRSGDGTLWAAFAIWDRPSRNGRFFCCRVVEIAPLPDL